MDKTMKEKRCLITGANSGIGKATAIQLAQAGAEIIMACRNPLKAEEAKKEIIYRSGNDKVSILLVDFAKQEEIRALAEEFNKKYDSLDILVNNAGLIAEKRMTTKEGYELTFAINHLGYFLLTHLLLDSLKASPNARIVNVASEAHRMGKLDFNDLHLSKDYSNIKAYGNSKLANILFTLELSKQLEGTNITANSLHPGVVNSNFGGNSSMFLKALVVMARPFMVSVEKGAETSMYLASSPEVEQVTGRYFVRKKQKRPSTDANDPVLAKKLWDVSLELTGLS